MHWVYDTFGNTCTVTTYFLASVASVGVDELCYPVFTYMHIRLCKVRGQSKSLISSTVSRKIVIWVSFS